jgi:hypothetical protein
MKTPSLATSVLLLASLLSPVHGAAVKDREGAVREDKAAWGNDARWAYNDLQRGFDEAKHSGKPLLVVLRCVPCLSCAGIDASVLTEPQLAPLLDKFVCVRVINANAIDLSLFQFDYDLSFSTLFFNGDGTLYGRFGSWTHQKDQHDKSTAGFKRSLEATLALHGGYPANKAALAGKQAPLSQYKTPVDIPTLQGKYRLQLDWNGKVVPSCVHCHQVGDALRAVARNKKEPMPGELIFPMPPPDSIGLKLAPDAAARVVSVTENSAAARSGFQPGDDILSLAQQPLISSADLSWVLHRAPDTGTLNAVVKRGTQEKSLTLTLPSGWRSKSDISGRVGTWGLRGMASGGLVLEDLADDTRAARNLSKDTLALRVKFVGQYGNHAAAKKAGFEKDDIIVEIAGLTERLSEGEYIGRMLQGHSIGENVKATVLRGDKRLELTMPMQ